MGTYREQRGAVLCRHDNLDRGIHSRLDADVSRHRHMVQTDGAREGVVAGAENAKLGHNLVLHMQRSAIGAVGGQSQVDLQHRRRMAHEPAGLERYGRSRRGPEGAVCCRRVATAWMNG